MTTSRCSPRGLMAAAVLAWLSACGGGGSGQGGNDGGGAAIALVDGTVVAGTSTAASPDIGARLSATSVLLERDVQERGNATNPTVSLLVSNPPGEGYYYRVLHTERAINYVGNSQRRADSGIDLQIGLSSPGALPMGIYDDTVTLEICLDARCAQPAKGSPFVVKVRLNIGFFAPSHPTLDAQVVATTLTLPHDLVAAAYSAALDAVVSVSAHPAPAINVHDLNTGLTRSQALSTVPTSLALAPDGLRAVVGHDAAVSVVQLAWPGSTGTWSVTRHPLSMPVGAVVFDGRDRVHAFSSALNWNPMRTLDLHTAIVTETPGAVFAGLYGVATAILHPAGDRLYAIDRGQSPDDLYVSVLSGDAPGALIDSPYHGDYPMCGGVWPSSDGQRLYTGCGNTFAASANRSLDMRYTGAMALTAATISSGRFTISSLSEHPRGTQVVLLEQPSQQCDARLDQLISCFTTISTFDPVTLGLTGRHALAPITVGPDRFAQVGRQVFHRSNGQVVLLSELRSAPDPTASIRLSLLP